LPLLALDNNDNEKKLDPINPRPSRPGKKFSFI